MIPVGPTISVVLLTRLQQKQKTLWATEGTKLCLVLYTCVTANVDNSGFEF
jgi:hypothetical protein